MELLNDTANVDESCTSLDSEPYVPPSKKKKEEKKEENTSWTYFLTMISKKKLDMGPHLWVLDRLVIAHPAHP